jgi:ubiquinone/menaquinone biosynthesis C-methylase UbiE
MRRPKEKIYVHYGCGHSAPEEWKNFDVSPTLRIQKIPILGIILKKKLNTTFPKNVLYGDIARGLPIKDNSCDGLYCSHVLEHLSLQDFRKALINSYIILKKGGIFRCVVPDLETAARIYIKNFDSGNSSASLGFFDNTLLGISERPRSFKDILSLFWGNSRHLWMWDKKSLAEEFRKAGFTQIRECKFNDSEDEMFKFVEDISRFESSVAIECRK